MQNAWKVGLFAVLFVALLGGAYQVLGKRLFGAETVKYYATFPDAGGINPGARVLMAGVKIGQVEKVELAGASQAKLTLAIEKDKKIPAGAIASMPTPLIGIGDSIIQIMPEPGKSFSATMLEPGATLNGTKLGALEGILPDMGTTISELNKTMVAVRQLVEDRELRGQLTELLQETTGTLKQFQNLAASANSALNENRGTIAGTLKTFAAAMQDVQKSAALAANLLSDPAYQKDAKAILASLNSTAKRADEIMASVQSIAADPSMKQSITETLANAKTMSETGTRIATNAEKMTDDGTKITENGVKISDNVVTLTNKVNALADDAKTVFEKIQKFFEKTPGTGSFSQLETEMSIQREFNPGRFRTDMNASYPIPGGRVHVGIFDAFETNKINAQFSKPVNKNTDYRYGVYAGQPGLGVDFQIAPKLQVRGDLFGLNDPRLDVRARIGLSKDILGWLGINRVGDGNVFSAGIGIKK